jgi:hypothetical protein
MGYPRRLRDSADRIFVSDRSTRAFEAPMSAAFAEDGLHFAYPENWELAREDNPSGWTVTLQSPATAFLMVTFDRDMPETELMIETALEAMKGEYEDLEFEPMTESIAGQPATGHDMRFFSLDLTNTCGTRSFYTETGTVLLFWQSADLDLELVESVFKALRASMTIDEA